MNRCATDGVPVAQSRSGRWVHLDELPKGTDPEHEIEVVTPREYLDRREQIGTLREVAQDMLAHHATLHPDSACEWAYRLRFALRVGSR